eukprot:285841-Chlamydomonas_euryale.AAC.3
MGRELKETRAELLAYHNWGEGSLTLPPNVAGSVNRLVSGPGQASSSPPPSQGLNLQLPSHTSAHANSRHAVAGQVSGSTSMSTKLPKFLIHTCRVRTVHSPHTPANTNSSHTFAGSVSGLGGGFSDPRPRKPAMLWKLLPLPRMRTPSSRSGASARPICMCTLQLHREGGWTGDGGRLGGEGFAGEKSVCVRVRAHARGQRVGKPAGQPR